jgi:methionyl-tRNA formyltransferase
VRLVFAGTPEAALPSLRALLASRHEVAAVLTRPDAPAGRGRRLTASPVKAGALDAGLEVLEPRRPSEPAFLDRLATIAPEACAVTAYGGLLPRAALDVPARGWVNLHFSLLPAWRGAAPVAHALLAGDEIAGATTFRIVAELDAGPTYGVITTEIGERATTGELLDRLAVDGARLLVATLDGIESGELVERAQPDEGVSTAPKLSGDDVRVDWSSPAMRVDRLVRAATPAPGAWTTFRGRRLSLGPVGLVTRPPRQDQRPATLRQDATGELHETDSDGLLVATGSGFVLLGDVQPEGKAAMPAVDWARGARLVPGERLQ